MRGTPKAANLSAPVVGLSLAIATSNATKGVHTMIAIGNTTRLSTPAAFCIWASCEEAAANQSRTTTDTTPAGTLNSTARIFNAKKP